MGRSQIAVEVCFMIEELFMQWEKLQVNRDGRPCELDLGCGSGAFSCTAAKRFPERDFLACDVMIGRLRKVENRAKAAGIDGNLRILRCEARNLLGRLLPDGSLDAIHILCPDPWPKNKHRGHRLLCSDFMAQIHRVLKNDGILHFSSDDRDYCRLMAENVEGSGLFRPSQESGAPWAGIVTDFERKWIEIGRTVEHRFWQRNPLPAKTIGH